MKIIDLTLTLENSLFIYPGDPKVNIEQLQTIEKNGWNMKRLHINGHDGTHVNVPIHCLKNGKTLNDYHIDDFYGECFLYEKDADITPNKGIIFPTQISQKQVDKIITIKPKFVGLTAEVDEEIEIQLLHNNIILFERLINTNQLPKNFIFHGAPLKIKAGDGSPVRAYAICN